VAALPHLAASNGLTLEVEPTGLTRRETMGHQLFTAGFAVVALLVVATQHLQGLAERVRARRRCSLSAGSPE